MQCSQNNLTKRQCNNLSLPGNNQCNSIDIVKFICAILVISIHVAPLGLSDNQIINLLNYGIQNWFSRIAVPLFFVMSGYFLYRKTTTENFSLLPTKNYIIKLIKLYIIWTIIYSPFRITTIISNKNFIHDIIEYIRDIVFAGSYSQLWFFPALIFSVTIISFQIYRKIELKRILFYALFFYVIGLLAQSWFGLIVPLREKVPLIWNILKELKKIIVTTRDGLFEGFLFVGIGAYFAFYGITIQKKTAMICFFASYILMFIEAFIVQYYGFEREHDTYVFLVPLTFFAFALILNWDISSNSKIFKILRILSSLIFYIHQLVRWCINTIFNLIGFPIDKTCLLFLMTIFMSVALSYLIYSISQRPGFLWIKWLYT